MTLPVADLHADLLWRLESHPYDPLADAPGEHFDLTKMRAGGAALLGAAVYTPEDHASPGRGEAYGEKLLGILDALVARSDGALRRVGSRGEAAAALARPDPRGPALLLTMEGAAPLGTDPARLDRWFARGLRVLGLTHNPRNAAGDGTGVPVAERRRGLTPFGRDLVRRAGDLGVVLDLAHLAEEACGDLFDLARGPVVCTHAGVRAVKDQWRNLSDAQVRSIAASGGVVGVDAYPGHVAREGSGTLDDVAAHLEHVVSLVGVRHAALGADFAGFDGPTVAGMEDASCYPRLAAHLRGRGWREEDLEAVWWRNWHRVLSERPV